MLEEPDYSDHVSPLEGYTLEKEDVPSEGYEFYVDRMSGD